MRSRSPVNKLALSVVVSALVVAALVAALLWHPGHKQTGTAPPPPPLLVYCAANLRVPLEEVGRDYEKETGTHIEAQFAGSQTMLTNAEISKRGDLFLPADDSYVQIALQKSMIDRSFPIAAMHPVLAVQKGNPKGIHTVDDLLRPGVQIAQANAETAAIGKVTKPVLESAKLWEPLKAQTRTFQSTVTDVANAVKLGTVDAGIVWDTTVTQTQGLEAVELPVFAGTEAKVVISVLKYTTQSAAAVSFAQYMANPRKGRLVFSHYGYNVKVSPPILAIERIIDAPSAR